MRDNQKNKQDGWVMLNTKVPPEVAQLFDILANQRGMKSYELLQLLVQGFITSAKHTGPLTPQIRLLLEALKTDAAYQDAFNFASPTAREQIAQMVLILQQPGKCGFGLVMIDHPFMSTATMTYCVDDILERVTEVSMVGLYKNLRQIGISIGSESMRETLVIMCDAQLIAQLDDEFQQEMPQMGNFTDYGRAIEYAAKKKAHQHRTPDGEANRQQRIKFTDEDREAAEQEAQRDLSSELSKGHALDDDLEQELGFRPHGSEW
ncbi:MAG: hypothetical protein II822_00885 [Prevotella sp.]|nr:hypothetical protein [Prevotella sp.]